MCFEGYMQRSRSTGLTYAYAVAPTLKHLFQGLDITLFAYGVTGTGKTHTMRGGKKLADRGVIPRLLSGIYRRGRKLEKDSQGETTVEVSMSYYEIYNVSSTHASWEVGRLMERTGSGVRPLRSAREENSVRTTIASGAQWKDRRRGLDRETVYESEGFREPL